MAPPAARTLLFSRRGHLQVKHLIRSGFISPLRLFVLVLASQQLQVVKMMRSVFAPVARVSNVTLVRPFAASASARDPIQQLFLDKIKEYRQKSASAPNGLVDADASTSKALKEDQERLKRQFSIKDGEETVITSKFDQKFQCDSHKMEEWK